MSSLNKFIIAILFFLSSFFETKAHVFHTSLTQIEYNNKTKSFEVSIRIFSDDLEKAIAQSLQQPKLKIDLSPKADELIFNYIKKCFSFKNNNKHTEYQYIGKQVENDVTWIYIELPANSCENWQIECSLLTEIFSDQMNIVNWQCLEKKVSYLFDKNTKKS